MTYLSVLLIGFVTVPIFFLFSLKKSIIMEEIKITRKVSKPFPQVKYANSKPVQQAHTKYF